MRSGAAGRPFGPAAEARHPVCLTRRGRGLVTGVLSAATVTAAVALGWAVIPAQAARSGPPPGAVYRDLRQVTVRPGQSLWVIAERAEPGADPRFVVQQIVELNALPSSTAIQPGEQLWVPRG